MKDTCSKRNELSQLSSVLSALEALYEVIENLHSTLEFSEIQKSSLKLLKKHLKVNGYLFAVYDSSLKKFIFEFENNLKGISVEEILKISLESVLKGDFEACDELHLPGYPNLTLMRIKNRKRLTGIFVATHEEMKKLKEEDLLLLKTISCSILYAFTNARLYEMAKRLAIWDTKTDLYNYRYFVTRLSLEIARANRYGRKLSIIAIDLDKFKEVNDSLGHVLADRVLKDVARLIKESIRTVDIPARFGGDEFFILLPETDMFGAKVVARRLKENVESRLFPLKSKKNRIKIELSYGVAELSEGMTAKQLMHAADMDLLQNKQRSCLQ